MSDATSLLYDREGFAVVSVEPCPGGLHRVVILPTAAEHGCPRCGVIAGGRPYDVRPSRVKTCRWGTGGSRWSGANAATAAPKCVARNGSSWSGRRRSRRGTT